MKFIITPQRNVLGTDVAVVIESETNEPIAHVTIECDDSTSSDREVDPPEVSYHQDLNSAVRYTPGSEHLVRVTVIDIDGKRMVASRRWVDR
jgi:hypothetical protein